MQNPTTTLAHLACVLHLSRPHGAKAERNQAIRLLLRDLAGRSGTVALVENALLIGDRALEPSAPGAEEVVRVMAAHRVGRIDFRAGLEAWDLEVLAECLTAEPGRYADGDDLIAALGESGRRVILRFEPEDPSVSLVPRHASARQEDEAFTGMRMLDLGPIEPAPPAAPPEDAPPLLRAMGRESGPREDPAILDRLKRAWGTAEQACDEGAMLEAVKGFLDAERRAGGRAGHMYRLELKRVVSRRHVARFALLTARREYGERALEVLRQLGPDAAEVLMDELVKADSRKDRQAFYSALTRLGTGAEVIIQHLSHPTWFVVRNAADLCGDMCLTGAVPRLAGLTTHPDPQVRQSVATALQRIGTPEAEAALCGMVTENDPAAQAAVLRGLAHLGTPAARDALRGIVRGQDRGWRRLREEAAGVLATLEKAGSTIP
jgi:hypothetical protein